MQSYLKPYIMRAGITAGVVGIVVLLLSLIPVVGLCFALLAWVVYVAAGVLTVIWGKGQGAGATLQQAAIDGGIAGGIAGVIAGVVKWVVDIVIGIAFSTAFSETLGSQAAGFIGSVVFGLIGVIIGIIIAAILGAIGGLVYTAIQQQQKKAA